MSERVRFMRLMVFFDLPTETAPQRREYNRFHRFLLKNGYLMLQKSVYTKLAIDGRMFRCPTFAFRGKQATRGNSPSNASNRKAVRGHHLHCRRR